MAKPLFTPIDLQFELRVKIFRMRSSGLLPDDVNALVLGAIDGMSTSKTLLTAGYSTSYGEQLSELFVKYEDGSHGLTPELVEEINKTVITRDILKVSDLSSWSTYGDTKSALYYIDGFVIAHAWGMQLYWSAKNHGLVSADARLTAVRQIESMNLYSVL